MCAFSIPGLFERDETKRSANPEQLMEKWPEPWYPHPGKMSLALQLPDAKFGQMNLPNGFDSATATTRNTKDPIQLGANSYPQKSMDETSSTQTTTLLFD
jgi:hypothetical protein